MGLSCFCAAKSIAKPVAIAITTPHLEAEDWFESPCKPTKTNSVDRNAAVALVDFINDVFVS